MNIVFAFKKQNAQAGMSVPGSFAIAKYFLVQANVEPSATAMERIRLECCRSGKGVIVCTDKQQAEYVKSRIVAADIHGYWGVSIFDADQLSSLDMF